MATPVVTATKTMAITTGMTYAFVSIGHATDRSLISSTAITTMGRRHVGIAGGHHFVSFLLIMPLAHFPYIRVDLCL